MPTQGTWLQAICMLSLVFTAGAARAQTAGASVTYNFAGIVSGTKDGYSGIAVGTPITGTYIFTIGNGDPGQSTPISTTADWKVENASGLAIGSPQASTPAYVFTSTAKVGSVTYTTPSPATGPGSGSISYVQLLHVGTQREYIAEEGNEIIRPPSATTTASLITINGILNDKNGLPILTGQSFNQLNTAGEFVTSSGTVSYYLTSLSLAEATQPTMLDPVPQLLSGAKLSVDPSVLTDAEKGRQVEGLATDGVTQVVIRIPASYAGEMFTVSNRSFDDCVKGSTDPNTCTDNTGLVFDPTHPPQDIFSNNASQHAEVSAVQTAGGPVAAVAFRAPVDFVRPDVEADVTAAQRSTFLEIESQNGSLTRLEVKLVRPPVLLVHGLWASAANWDQSASSDLRQLGLTLLQDKYSRFTVDAADYGDPVPIQKSDPNFGVTSVSGSSLGINYGAAKTADAAKKLLKDFSNVNNPVSAPVAVIQADFVAHSMGSLVTRQIQHLKPSVFASAENYQRGFIHKVISLGGPHLGSPVAREMLKRGRPQDDGVDNSCVIKAVAGIDPPLYVIDTYVDSNGQTHSGAIADLAGNGDGTSLSPALQILQQRGTLWIAYVAGTLTDQEILALSGDSSFPKSSCPAGTPWVYGPNRQFCRAETGLDDLKAVCNGVYSPLLPLIGQSIGPESPLLNSINAQKFSGFMGNGNAANGASDGVVPLTSAANGKDQVVTLNPLDTQGDPIGTVHSGGMVLLGFGVIDPRQVHSETTTQVQTPAPINTLLDTDAANEVVILLNTPVTDAGFYVPEQ